MANTDNQEVKSKRDAMSERLKSRYPEREFVDDEAMYAQISDDYDDFDKEISGYKDREKKLSDMFSADPKSAHFLTNWKNGGDPVVELVRMFGTDIKDAIDDPAKLEEITAANQEFVERVAKEKELEDQYKTNLEESMNTLKSFQESRGLSDDEVDKMMEFIMGIVGDGIMGKFTDSTMDMAMKAMNHDADVEVANQEGEVRGRNAKIEEKLRTRSKGDGVAALDGKNTNSKQRPQRNLGVLENYGENYGDIWSRGDEKRTKIIQ